MIAVSNGTQTGIIQTAKVQPKSICTIYNPFDFDEIKNLSTSHNANIPQDDYIIHAARFDLPHKRQDVLLEAFSKLKSNFKLVLLTQPCEPLTKLIKKFKVENKVIIAGFQKNPYPWFKQAKLTILCSDFESFGNVIVESLICNTPVVSTDCISGPNEILTGDMSDWLVPINNPAALTKKIDQLLTNYQQTQLVMNSDSTLNTLNKFKTQNILAELIKLSLHKQQTTKQKTFN